MNQDPITKQNKIRQILEILSGMTYRDASWLLSEILEEHLHNNCTITPRQKDDHE